MTTAGGQRPYGDAAGTEADTASVPGDDRTAEGTEEVLDGELVEVEVPVDEVVEAEAADVDPLEVALAQRDEYLDSLRRLQAEFENYKKRVAKQQVDQVARAAASLVDKLLPVLDALDLATDHVGDAEDAGPRESGEPVVAQVMRAGYRWNGTVVRPAMVMVEG